MDGWAAAGAAAAAPGMVVELSSHAKNVIPVNETNFFNPSLDLNKL